MSNPIDRALKASLSIRQAHATGGEVGQFQDTPENRQRLRELGTRNYEYGYKSLSPAEKGEYDQLTRGYNFPPEVSEGIHTYEDYVANELQYLQRNLHPERLTGSYAEGGAVDAYDAMGNYIGPAPTPDAKSVMDPSLMGRAWAAAREAYKTRREDEPMLREAPTSTRDEIGASIAGDGRSSIRRGAADLLVGSTGLPDSGTLGFGAADGVPFVGGALNATDVKHAYDKGDKLGMATGTAAMAVPFAKPIARTVGQAIDVAKKYALPAAAGAGAALAPEEAEASFAGILSKTANHADRAAAQMMRKEGVDPATIWRRTGWGRDPGGNALYEINDSAARLRKKGVEQMQSGGYDMRVGDVLHHPQLFDAYPSSFDTPLVTHSRQFDNPALRGFYDGGYDSIGLRPDLEGGRQLETLLHELQHRHQRIEGHQPGGSPDLFPDKRPALTANLSAMSNMAAILRLQDSQGMKFWDAYDIIAEKLPLQERQLINTMQREGLTDPVALSEAMASVTEQLNKLQNEPTPFEKYRRLVGEQLAELPAARLKMTDDQRRMNYPLDLPDPISLPNTKSIGNPDSPVWEKFKAALMNAREKRAGGGKLVSSIMDEVISAVSNIGKTPGKPAQVKIPGLGMVDAAPIPSLQGAADSYMRSVGRPGQHHIERYPAFNEDFARRVAESFEALKHDPENPAVRRAYDAMIDETMAQYKAVKDSGLDVRFLKDGQADPYAASPSLGYDDIQRNGRLYVFPTDNGFGSNSLFDAAGNPLLKGVGKVGDKGDAVANDAFRVVHDVFGHFGPGNPFFRAPGEERAYQNHSRMYSPEARGAMAMETRGQNSWVNYGPHGEKNRTASGGDTIYADQKINVLPEWAQETPPEKAGGGSIVQKALRKLSDLGFYSHGAEAAQALKQAKGEPAQMKQMLLKQGVKPAELDHAGYDVITQGKGSITRDEIAEMLQNRMPNVGETVKGGAGNPNHAKYGDYTLPQGEEYNERLLTLDRTNPALAALDAEARKIQNARLSGEIDHETYKPLWDENFKARGEMRLQDRKIRGGGDPWPAYDSDHWDKPNILAHMRHNDRWDTSGRPVFHVEEFQSDWAQQGRQNGFMGKGFNADLGEVDPDGLVPPAPFVTSTQGWTDLAVKRALRLAAEKDRSAITWPTGQQQADRFGLEKHFSKLEYSPTSGRLIGYDPHGYEVIGHHVGDPSKLEAVVGRDMAARLMAAEPQTLRGYQLYDSRTGRPARDDVHSAEDTLWERYPGLAANGNYEARPIDRFLHSIQGDDLKMGGEGMAGYYDNILPKRFQEVARKFDPNARVMPHGYRTDLDDGWGTSKEIEIHGIPLSNELKDKVLQGIPLFAGGGSVVQKAVKAAKQLMGPVDTASPGFQSWHEGSAIPAERYFHGTSKDKDFPDFKTDRHGAWFTRNPDEASSYAVENDSKGYKADGWNMVPTNTADRVIPTYLRATNPFRGDKPESILMQENYKRAQSDWFDQLRAQGHDAWLPESAPDLAVILGEPGQIKSTITNTGDFSRTNKRIDRAEGGAVEPQGEDVDALMDYAASLPQKDPSLIDRAMGVIKQLNPIGSAEAAPFDSVGKVIGKVLKPAAPAIRTEAPMLFDYSKLREVPNVPQVDLERYVPPRGVPERTEALADRKNVNRVNKVVDEGAKLGGLEWYNTEPLMHAFIGELGREKGLAAYQSYLDMVAATSPRSNVGTNARNASYYYMLREQGQHPAKPLPSPYGHIAQNLHIQNFDNVVNNGGWPVLQNPKPASFAENLAGNQKPVTVDTHNARLWGLVNSKGEPVDMPAKSEYGFMERLQQREAAKKGMTPAQYQASAWIGGGAETGLRSSADPFLKVFEDRVALTAHKLGLPKEEVLRRMIRGEMPLKAEGGAVSAVAMARRLAAG